MQESPRNAPDSLQALQKSAGAMRKLQAELKRAAAASPWARERPAADPTASASMALVPVNATPPPVSAGPAGDQVSALEAWAAETGQPTAAEI